jgi:hypothetical protein
MNDAMVRREPPSQPILTAPQKDIAMTRPERWFIAAPYARVGSTEDRGHPPGSGDKIVHAKEMGTTRTACGQDASSWFKFWHLSFLQCQGRRCPHCVRAVSEAHRDSQETGSTLPP